MIVPSHLRLFKYTGDEWSMFESNEILLWNDKPHPNLDDIEALFGVTFLDAIAKIIKRLGRKKGYYIGDMKSDRYYYCGEKFEDVKTQLLKLGIGRNHPQGF